MSRSFPAAAIACMRTIPSAIVLTAVALSTETAAMVKSECVTPRGLLRGAIEILPDTQADRRRPCRGHQTEIKTGVAGVEPSPDAFVLGPLSNQGSASSELVYLEFTEATNDNGIDPQDQEEVVASTPALTLIAMCKSHRDPPYFFIHLSVISREPGATLMVEGREPVELQIGAPARVNFPPLGGNFDPVETYIDLLPNASVTWAGETLSIHDGQAQTIGTDDEFTAAAPPCTLIGRLTVVTVE